MREVLGNIIEKVLAHLTFIRFKLRQRQARRRSKRDDSFTYPIW